MTQNQPTIPPMNTSIGESPILGAANRTFEDAVGFWTALLGTGMDLFEAIPHAAMGDGVLTGQLWMRALRLVEIHPGTFRVRTRKAKPKLSLNEWYQPIVRIGYSFQIGAVPVTQGAWVALMGNERPGVWPTYKNTQRYRLDDDPALPAVNMTWHEIGEPDGFLDRLNAVTSGARPKGQVFRLPSEAEWEYSCRAGTSTRWNFGDKPDEFNAHAWTAENSGGVIHAVGRKAPNPWGLYDMHGNVLERCLGAYEPIHERKPRKGRPLTGSKTDNLVERGGSCSIKILGCRSASRFLCHRVGSANNLGFRVVLSDPNDDYQHLAPRAPAVGPTYTTSRRRKTHSGQSPSPASSNTANLLRARGPGRQRGRAAGEPLIVGPVQAIEQVSSPNLVIIYRPDEEIQVAHPSLPTAVFRQAPQLRRELLGHMRADQPVHPVKE